MSRLRETIFVALLLIKAVHFIVQSCFNRYIKMNHQLYTITFHSVNDIFYSVLIFRMRFEITQYYYSTNIVVKANEQ